MPETHQKPVVNVVDALLEIAPVQPALTGSTPRLNAALTGVVDLVSDHRNVSAGSSRSRASALVTPR